MRSSKRTTFVGGQEELLGGTTVSMAAPSWVGENAGEVRACCRSDTRGGPAVIPARTDDPVVAPSADTTQACALIAYAHLDIRSCR